MVGSRILSHTIATVALSLVAIAAIVGGCTIAHPTVTRVMPCPCATGVCISPAVIQLSFDQPMDPISVECATFISPAVSPVAPRFGWAGNRSVTITFDRPFCPNTTYTVTVGTCAKAGNSVPLAQPYILKFTTGAAMAKGMGPLGTPAVTNLSFCSDIRSIAIVRCSSCHQGLMEDYTTAMYCKFVVPWNPDASTYYTIGKGACNHPGGNAWGDKAACVKVWIAAGAPE